MPATPPPDLRTIYDAVVRDGSLYSSVWVVAETGSTNADLAADARAGGSHGTVRMTDNQTAGRGRLDRSWTTPPGVSVACSVLLRPVVTDPQRWAWLPLMTGVALVDGVRRATGLHAGLKWPNDVLVGERKLCGLLAERVDTSHGPAVVLGFGTNVSMDADELPVPTATSLLLEGASTDKTALMIEILTALESAYTMWRSEPDELAERYADRCLTIGQDVRVLLAGGVAVSGRAVGIDATGGLRVRTTSGEQIFAAGDVVHLRR